MPKQWSTFVSRLNAAHAVSADTAAGDKAKRIAALAWLVLLAVSAASAPHDYVVIRSELMARPLGQILSERASGPFGDSIRHIGGAAVALLCVMVFTFRERIPKWVFAPFLVVAAGCLSLSLSGWPRLWFGLLVLAVALVLIVRALESGFRARSGRGEPR